MLKNYIKIAWRNITRHKAFSILNVAGLSIGIACSILILLWVQNETSYDRFHANANTLYRLVCSAGEFRAAVSPAGMAGGLQQEMPEIKTAVRLSKPLTNLFEVGINKFEEKRVFFADSNFLKVFSFPLIKGNAGSALDDPNSILITEEMAKKYFGNDEALGKVMRKDNNENFVVSGVLANLPTNSHLQFDFIIPMSNLAKTDEQIRNNVWGSFNYYTYLQLNENVKKSPADIDKLAARIKKIYSDRKPNLQIDFQLQPLTAIHLHSHLQIDLPGHGNIQYVNIFFIVAIFILIVACINFMNLATARSARRAKEFGLRKVVGAGRNQIILQFLGESLIISFLSLIAAIAIVYLLLPFFNLLAEKKISIDLLDGALLLKLIVIAAFTGIISGSYPALFLSGFQPVKVLKGKLNIGAGNLLMRNGLVVTQFVVAIILLAGTAVVYQQLNFIRNKNLGFDKSNLIYMPMKGDLWGRQDALKIALSENPLTADFSVISDLPTRLVTGTIDVVWEGKDPNSQVVIPSIDVDEHFIDVFKVELLAGRGFSTSFKADSSNYVVNEKALETMGMKVDNAVGKSLSFAGRKGTIIGVIKDFNFKSLQYAMEPLVLRLNAWGGVVMLRTSPGNTPQTIKALEKINHQLNPAYPFSYAFLDKDLDNLYQSEKQMGSIFNLFAGLAIFIACLGLYGLSAFMAEQRVKEIGVRKVLGATSSSIIYLLSGKFTKLIVIAMFIAVPLAWFAIFNWLKGFAYRIDLNWTIFLVASVSALIVAWITVSYESVKAALSNPVKSLRSE